MWSYSEPAPFSIKADFTSIKIKIYLLPEIKLENQDRNQNRICVIIYLGLCSRDLLLLLNFLICTLSFLSPLLASPALPRFRFLPFPLDLSFFGPPVGPPSPYKSGHFRGLLFLMTSTTKFPLKFLLKILGFSRSYKLLRFSTILRPIWYLLKTTLSDLPLNLMAVSAGRISFPFATLRTNLMLTLETVNIVNI